MDGELLRGVEIELVQSVHGGDFGDGREPIAILRVALLNGADYEYRAHVPFALQAGLTQAQIDALPGWQISGKFDDRERAVLAYTDCVTREIRAPDAVFAELRRHFDDRELVELTATVAGYNLVSRFLEAMQIDHEK